MGKLYIEPICICTWFAKYQASLIPSDRHPSLARTTDYSTGYRAYEHDRFTQRREDSTYCSLFLEARNIYCSQYESLTVKGFQTHSNVPLCSTPQYAYQATVQLSYYTSLIRKGLTCKPIQEGGCAHVSPTIEAYGEDLQCNP